MLNKLLLSSVTRNWALATLVRMLAPRIARVAILVFVGRADLSMSVVSFGIQKDIRAYSAG
jgi:hypothetical protein